MAATCRRLSLLRVNALSSRFTDAIRDRRAFDVIAGSPSQRDFSEFADHRQCLLVTFKRTGEPVPSPMNFGLADGKLYMRTDATMPKMKRISRDPHVVLVPCTLRGKPVGAAVAATARVLPPSQEAVADAILAANWSAGMTLVERGLDRRSRALDIDVVYLECTTGT